MLPCTTLPPRRIPAPWLIGSAEDGAATSASPSPPTSTQRVRVGCSDAAPRHSLGSVHAAASAGNAASATSELRLRGSRWSWLLIVPGAHRSTSIARSVGSRSSTCACRAITPCNQGFKEQCGTVTPTTATSTQILYHTVWKQTLLLPCEANSGTRHFTIFWKTYVVACDCDNPG